MKPLAVALQAVLGTALLVGCAAPGPAHPDVKPLLAIRDGGAAAADYYDLGRYYQAKDRYREAADAYRRAIALDDANADAHSALGAVLALQRNFPEAFRALERAVALAPNAARHRNNLGYAYYLAGDTARAVSVFEAAAAIEPGNARTWNNLGLALAAQGDADRAAAAYARGTAVAPGPKPAPAVSAPAAAAQAPGAAPAEALPAPALALAPIAVDATFVLQPLATAAEAQAALGVPLAPAAATLLEPLAPVAFAVVTGPVAEAVPLVALTDLPPADPAVPLDLAALRGRPVETAPLPLLPTGAALPPLAQEAVALTPFDPPEEAPMAPIAASPALVPLTMQATTPAPLAPDTVTPARVEAVIAEIPTAATVIELAPNALALAWTGMTVVLRDAPPAPPAHAARLEVANGNGVTGMARRVSMLLAAVGVRTARLTNQKPFAQSATVIEYRAGHREDAARLAARVPGDPRLVETAALRADTDVRLVLGRDLPVRVALRTPAADGTTALLTR